MLTKFTVEQALNAELEHHLATEEAHNTRNGYSSKTIRTKARAIELTTPRDHNATFEPALVVKTAGSTGGLFSPYKGLVPAAS